MEESGRDETKRRTIETGLRSRCPWVQERRRGEKGGPRGGRDFCGKLVGVSVMKLKLFVASRGKEQL